MKAENRGIVYFLCSVVFVKCIGMLSSFILAGILSPPDYGLWASLMLIISYSPIICMGTVEALVKKYPHFVGRGEVERGKDVEAGVLGSVIIGSGLLALLGICASLVMPSRILQIEHMALVRLMIIAAAISLFSAYFYQRCVAHQEFRINSVLETSRAILTFTCVTALSLMFGLPGAVEGIVVAEVLICIYSAKLSDRAFGRVHPHFNLEELGSLVRIGLPISLIWWMFMIQTSAGRVLSITLLGKAETGYYSLGASILSVLVLIPQVIGRSLFPRIGQEMGRGNDRDRIARLVILPARLFSFVMALGIGVMLMLVPAIYTSVFPKYRLGLLSAQVLLLGVYFFSVIRTGINYMVSANREKMLLVQMAACLVANIVLILLFVRAGFGITGVAAGTALSQVMLSTLVWIAVFRGLNYEGIKVLWEVIYLYLPFMAMVAFLAVIRGFFPSIFVEYNRNFLVPMTSFLILMLSTLYFIPPFKGWSLAIISSMKRM